MKKDTVDIKLGYTCNNNCFHCVIHPNKMRLIRQKQKTDLNYREVLSLIEQEKENIRNAECVVLTGGEPTIRADFVRIIEYIAQHFPGKRIVIQTNGRKLSRHLEKIKSMDVNIHFVIALHGPEHIHNDICDSNEPGSNPFKETMESLEKIKLLYGNISEMVRIEIVLSRKNLHYLTETIKMLEEIGAIRIGISYPHLDGYEHISPEKVKKRGFSYAEMQEELKKMVDYVKERNFIISVEAVPFCAVRDTNGEIYELPADVRLIDYLEPRNSAVYFLDWKCNDFEKLWTENHSKFSFCEECLINKLCMGVWIETLRCFGANGLKPITVQEAIKIKNALKRHRMEVKGDEDKCFSYC